MDNEIQELYQTVFSTQNDSLTTEISIKLPQGCRFHKFVALIKDSPRLSYIQFIEGKDKITFLAVYSSEKEKQGIVWKTPIHPDLVIGKNKQIYSCCQMISEDEFVMVNSPLNSMISIINPLKEQKVAFQWKFDKKSFVFSFKKTGYFCLIEPALAKVTYFASQISKKEHKPLAIYELDPDDDMSFQKLDETSKIWLQIPRKDDYIRGHYLSLQKRTEGEYAVRNRELRVNINQHNKFWMFKQIQSHIRNTTQSLNKNSWLFEDSILRWKMVGQITADEYAILVRDKLDKVNPFLVIINASEGEREAYFQKFEINHDLFRFPLCYDLQIFRLDECLILKLKVLRDRSIKKGEYMLFVSSKTKEIQNFRQLSSKEWKNYFLTINGEYTAEYSIQQKDKTIKLSKWSTPLKSIYVHFLLFLNEDLDDDLLFDCYELLMVE